MATREVKVVDTATLLRTIADQIKESDTTALFRDAMILEVLKIARPLIEQPFRDELDRVASKMNDPKSDDDDIIEAAQQAIEKLGASTSDG